MRRPSGLITTNIYFSSGAYTNWLDKTIDFEIAGTNTIYYQTNSFTYSNGLVYSRTDEHGLTVTNYWDNLQRLTGLLYPDGTTISNLYARLDLTATKDRLTNWIYFGYDSLRRKTAETNANNVITRYGYCDCGGLTYITNAYGTTVQQLTVFNYDDQANRISTIYPDGTTSTNWFDSLRRVIVTGDAVGLRWFGYNNHGPLAVVTNSYGIERLTVFDIEDRVYTATDANNVTVTNTYDALGRLLTRTYPDGGGEKFGYSARGLTHYTNQLSLVTRYDYDAVGRKVAETNANSEIIGYTYNAAGDLKTLTDGRSNVTTWNYDQYGRLTNKLDQANTEILRYKYDANSRLTNRWSVAKGDTKYSYDAVGNLTLADYPSGTTDISLQYDALNRATNMVDAAGTTKYTYAANGQLLTEDGPWASDTVTYSYNNARMRSGLSLQQPTGTWTNGFIYDGAHRLTNVTSPAGAFAYIYKGPGTQVTNLALPNASKITNAFDNMARLTGTYLVHSSGSISNKHEYLYNAANQRIRHTRADGSYYTNSYDNIGQLKVADSTTASEDRYYGYDAGWNLSKRSNNTTVYTFTVNNKNELTNYNGSTFTYDSNGNLTGASSPSYTYDAENQLASAQVTATWRSEFTYDGRGRLRKRIEYGWTGSSWYPNDEIRYLYDGMRVIQERNSGNTPTVAYTRGNDLSGTSEAAGGIGGLLARSHGYSSGSLTNHNCYHADGGGNITYMVNSSQSMVASYRYDPFGNSISQSGSLASANGYRFSSKEIHANSGMYYYGFRFYDPNLQRWLNRDPIEELGGVNLYRFARNNPINERDSVGLSSAECEAARQALADALRNFDTAPGPLTQAALVAAVAAEAAACSGDDLPPLPPPTPLPKCEPVRYRTPPFPGPPPLGGSGTRGPIRQSFCGRHPTLCIGIGVGAVGVAVGATCFFQPELCAGAIRIGVGLGRGIIGTVGAGAPVLAPAAL